MSTVSNHTPEVIESCRFDLPPGSEVDALADAPASWSQPPSDEEVNAMAAYDAAAHAPAGADEDPPAADHKVAAPTDARQARKPRQKPARSVRLLSRTHGMYELPDTATVEITMTTSGPRIGDRTDRFRYTVVPLASDFGRAFQVTREDTDDTYAVNLNGRQSTCECAGHLKWGNCNHVDAMQALVSLGKL